MESITIQWGTVASREDNPPKTYEFNTQAELDAFLLGIDEMDGWMEYEVVEDADPNNDEFKCHNCSAIHDIEDSVKIGEVLMCVDCAPSEDEEFCNNCMEICKKEELIGIGDLLLCPDCDKKLRES